MGTLDARWAQEGGQEGAQERIPALAKRVTDGLASEWIKARSVKSTYWLVVAAAVTAVGGSAITALARHGANKPDPFDPVGSVFIAWLVYPILALGVLGVLSFASEYGSGQIRTTYAATPQRFVVLASKAGVVGAIALAVAEAAAFASFLLHEAILGGHSGATSLSHPGVLGEVLAAGFSLFAIAMLGLALGAIVRNTAGAIVALPALIYLPLIVLSLPHGWSHTLGKFTLLIAAYELVSEHSQTGLLSWPLSLMVVIAWPTAALAIAGVLVRRRDV